MSFGNHFWTLFPFLLDRLRPPVAPAAEAWALTVDGDRGNVPLRGALHVPDGAHTCVVLVHGLGGCSSSSYLLRAAAAAARAGVASLRLSMRGAEGDGADLYHAGLSSDLVAALASPALERFDRLALLGYSLGGHLALRAATEEGLTPRLRQVAAVCSPLELSAAQASIDRPSAALYRVRILRHLSMAHEIVAERHPERAGDHAAVRAAKTLRAFDRASVVKRFGFADVDDYYRQASVCHRLAALEVPALLVAVKGDPLVAASSIEPWSGGSPLLDVRWLDRGGHVHMPRRVDLGLGIPGRLEEQLVRWLQTR